VVLTDDRHKCGPQINIDLSPTLQGFWGTGGNNVPTVICGFQGGDLAHAIRSSPSKADKPDSSTYVVQEEDRIGGWVDREDRIFAYQSDSKRSTAQELIFHKPQGKADSLTQQKQNVISSGVRRITPTECERLQGFPDGWTLLDGKTPDSPRYRSLGNAVCVNVAEWIGKRIREVIG